MQFKSDEQRKAVFARLKGGRRGSGRRPPRERPGGDPIMDILGDWLTGGGSGGSGDDFVPRRPGQGIPGWGGGSVTLTGGAIYNTPGSSWYLHAGSNPPNHGALPGYGIGPYEQIFTPGWVPPETLAGQIWTILVNGLDVHSGMPAPRLPGDPGYFGMLEAEFSSNPGGWITELDTSAPTRPNRNPWNPFG